MKIDLARKNTMDSMATPISPEMKTPSYPCLHIDCGEALLEDLPDSGVMEIKFKVVSRSCSERDGKKDCCVTLEVQTILDVEAEEEKDGEKESTGSVLDRLAKLEAAGEDSED